MVTARATNIPFGCQIAAMTQAASGVQDLSIKEGGWLGNLDSNQD